MLFRELNADEVAQFKQWARDNYKTFHPIDELWHPVVQAECIKMNFDAGNFVEIPNENS